MITKGSDTDIVLLQGLYNGDEVCFTAIFNRYWKELFYQAEAILGEELLSQDCVQEVFLSLWRRRTEVEIDHLQSYLKKAIRFQCLSMMRAKKVRVECLNRISKITVDFVTEQPGLFKELDGLFKDVLSSLPDDQREIFQLVREEGLSYKEIAERKSISIKTVEKKMSSSLKTFRYKLGEMLSAILVFLIF